MYDLPVESDEAKRISRSCAKLMVFELVNLFPAEVQSSEPPPPSPEFGVDEEDAPLTQEAPMPSSPLSVPTSLIVEHTPTQYVPLHTPSEYLPFLVPQLTPTGYRHMPFPSRVFEPYFGYNLSLIVYDYWNNRDRWISAKDFRAYMKNEARLEGEINRAIAKAHERERKRKANAELAATGKIAKLDLTEE